MKMWKGIKKMYSDKVMDHFSNPRNVGEIENANAVGEVGNAKCGDIMKIYMDIEDGFKEGKTGSGELLTTFFVQ